MTPEGKIQRDIVKYLSERGILHRRYSATANAYGYPDIDVWFAGTYIGLEVKTDDGVATDLQIGIINAIIATGNHAYIVKSKEEVIAILSKVGGKDIGVTELPKTNT